eukprot:SAG31_NODE_3881_length_3789_cov_2.824390_7_plen_160_part_00
MSQIGVREQRTSAFQLFSPELPSPVTQTPMKRNNSDFASMAVCEQNEGPLPNQPCSPNTKGTGDSSAAAGTVSVTVEERPLGDVTTWVDRPGGSVVCARTLPHCSSSSGSHGSGASSGASGAAADRRMFGRFSTGRRQGELLDRAEQCRGRDEGRGRGG